MVVLSLRRPIETALDVSAAPSGGYSTFLVARGDEPADATVPDTPAADADDDAEQDWPLLSQLDLDVCVTDSAIPGTAAFSVLRPAAGGS